MSTVVVHRPHHPHIASRTGAVPATTHSPRPTGRVLPAPVGRALAHAQSASPACADQRGLFLDPALEQEPVPSASARLRRRYADLAHQATDVCAACPLLSACLYRAVVEYDVAGFVAGTTERQRQQIRSRLGVQVEPEDFDTLAGVVGGRRAVDHDEVVRLRRAHPDEGLERIAYRLGCSLSTVKRHLRQERNRPAAPSRPLRPRPTQAEVRSAAGAILVKVSASRCVAA
ncbi:MAG: WhiB family transcriptional regulator [Microlunatus sp.]|nr:WhiB family transcriptional regulator [Microlunatus sp.]